MSDFQQAVADQSTAPAPVEGGFPEVAPTPAPTPPQVQALEDGSVVVDGKIYKPEAAAKKIEHADTHIQILERENAEKDARAFDLLGRIEALEKTRKHTDALDQLVANAQPAPAPPPPEQPRIQEVSKDELVDAAVDRMKAEQVATQQEANLNASIALAQSAFGDSYGLKIDEYGAKHSMSVEQVVEMAKNQPSVFKALFIPPDVPNGKPDTTGSTVAGVIGQGHNMAPTTYKSILKMNAKERSAEIQRRMSALSNPG